jgi:Domain of unknown function (DUF4864)
MLRIFVVALFLCMSAFGAQADELSPAEKTEFQRIISAQIQAFRADDGKAAYGFAAPLVKQAFPSVDMFMGMVKQGYPQVYRPQSFAFEDAALDPVGRPTQKVSIVGPDGKSYLATYTMQKQEDGTWRIAGCTLSEIPGVDA